MEVPNFVTFHFINAYQEITGVDELLHGKPGTRIIVDCCEHEANPVILKRMTLEELRSYPGKVLPDARWFQIFLIFIYIYPMHVSGDRSVCTV